MLKPKTYNLLVRCVEDGVRLGLNRAHKYSDQPSDETLTTEIENSIINEICEWFDFVDNVPLQDE